MKTLFPMPLVRRPRWGRPALLAGCASLLLLSVVAQASEPMSPRPVGVGTTEWLDLQKAQKPTGEEAISGDQAALIRQRHVESFGRAIPDELRRERGVGSGASGQ